MVSPNQKPGKCSVDYNGFCPHFKYNKRLIHLMPFANWRQIGRGNGVHTLSITSMLTTLAKLVTCELFS